jgi:hypothetical protein
MDADGADLARWLLHPDARQAVDASALDAVSRKRANDRLLEVTDVALHVSSVSVEVEDRVADELPGGVIRRLAAAVRLHDLDVSGGGDMDLGLVRASANGDHG